MDTTSSTSLPFSVDPGRTCTNLGKVKQTKWLLSAKWTLASTYCHDLKALRLIRQGNVEDDVLILVKVMQRRKDEIPLYLYKNFPVIPNPGQTIISIFPKDFFAAFDNTDRLTGTVTIFDMANCKALLDSTEDEKTIDSLPQLSDDFASLLNQPDEFSDVTLKCGTSEIPAHKCILSIDADQLSGTVTIFDMAKCKALLDSAEDEETIDSLPQLSDDFACLLNQPDEFSDVTLKCGTIEIPAHKCILSARSPVFAEMFRHQEEENLSGTIDIVDIEVHVLQAILRYLYTDKIGDISNVLAGDLLFAAGEYKLKVLKRICVDKLKRSLSMENVFRVLVLGHLHDDGLKEHTKKFICESKNRDKFWKLLKTEEWKSLRKKHSDLAMDVLRSLAKFLIQPLTQTN